MNRCGKTRRNRNLPHGRRDEVSQIIAPPPPPPLRNVGVMRPTRTEGNSWFNLRTFSSPLYNTESVGVVV